MISLVQSGQLESCLRPPADRARRSFGSFPSRLYFFLSFSTLKTIAPICNFDFRISVILNLMGRCPSSNHLFCQVFLCIYFLKASTLRGFVDIFGRENVTAPNIFTFRFFLRFDDIMLFAKVGNDITTFVLIGHRMIDNELYIFGAKYCRFPRWAFHHKERLVQSLRALIQDSP